MQDGHKGTETNATVRDILDSDRDVVVSIFNHYARTSYAAYPDVEVGSGFFSRLQEESLAFPVLEVGGAVVGFGLLRPVLPFPAFLGTGMLTYFILPEFTGRGLGDLLLGHLTGKAAEMGMTSLVANMASKNTASIRFHERHGFREVGRIHGAGRKFGEPFDVVWMQKEL